MVWFKRLYDWTTDEANGVNILSERMDAEDDNFATALNKCITIDGTNPPTADLPMANRSHTGVGLSTSGSIDEYATVKQTQSGAYVWGGTTGGTLNAYTITPLIAPPSYATGMAFRFKANRTNSGATTLNVSNLGAKAVWANGAACTGDEIVTGRTYEAVFDGTNFQLTNGTGSGSSFGGAKICLSSPQSSAHNAGTIVTFRTVIYDDSEYYTIGNNYFEIPTDGRYRFTANIVIRWDADTEFGVTMSWVQLYMNGAEMPAHRTTNYASAYYTNQSPYPRPGGQLVVEGTFEEGDQLGVHFLQSNAYAKSVTLMGNGNEHESCYMAIERIF